MVYGVEEGGKDLVVVGVEVRIVEHLAQHFLVHLGAVRERNAMVVRVACRAVARVLRRVLPQLWTEAVNCCRVSEMGGAKEGAEE